LRKVFTAENTGVHRENPDLVLDSHGSILRAGRHLLLAWLRAGSGGGSLGMMADIGSQNPEDDILGNVGGVVGDAFEVACHQESIQRLLSDLRPSFILRTSTIKLSSRMRSTT